MRNTLVTGANGQLGSEIKGLASDPSFIFVDSKTIDITDSEKIGNIIKSNNIKTIINCAAYTAVDRAESNPKIADQVNHLAVRNLATICKNLDIKLIHISTDYVFDGTSNKPYKESDNTNPQNVYGQTKLAGEKAILEIQPKNSIIIRTSWLYSAHSNNFLKTMLKLGRERTSLKVVYDQVGTPTYARDLANLILEIIPKIDNQNPEIYHFSNEGVLSWYDFAKEIMEITKLKCKIDPINTAEYPTPATRPHYSLLDKSKIKLKFNISIPYWKESLKTCLKISQAGKDK